MTIIIFFYFIFSKPKGVQTEHNSKREYDRTAWWMWQSTGQGKCSRTWPVETYLVFIKQSSVVEVGMGEYPVHSATDWAKFGHRRLFYAHSAKKIKKISQNTVLHTWAHKVHKKCIIIKLNKTPIPFLPFKNLIHTTNNLSNITN